MPFWLKIYASMQVYNDLKTQKNILPKTDFHLQFRRICLDLLTADSFLEKYPLEESVLEFERIGPEKAKETSIDYSS